MKTSRIRKCIHLVVPLLLVLFLTGFADPELVEASLQTNDPKKEIIVLIDTGAARTEKKALLILPGFGDSNKGRRHQRKHFSGRGYDLYIPDFKDRESIDATVLNLEKFYYENNLNEYKEVFVFSYIMGAWVLNQFIRKHGKENISAIVYDRSPLQERAPRVIAERIPLIGRIAVGEVLIDLSKIPYPPIDKGDIRIGILVESVATPLIRIFRKRTMSYGQIDWQDLDFRQEYDDLIYIPINHDEMYIRFDVVGDDIMQFFRTGAFNEGSRRVPYDWDVFKNHKPDEW